MIKGKVAKEKAAQSEREYLAAEEEADRRLNQARIAWRQAIANLAGSRTKRGIYSSLITNGIDIYLKEYRWDEAAEYADSLLKVWQSDKESHTNAQARATDAKEAFNSAGCKVPE